MAVLRAYTLQDLFANLAGSINSNTDTSSQFEVVDNFVNDGETLILNVTATPPTFTTSTNYPDNIAGDYPTSYWRLADNAATGSAVDSNQNLLSAYPRITSSSMTSITQHAASFLAHSGSAQFTASTSAIVFTSGTSLQLVGDLTVEFWVNLASLGSPGTSYGLVTKDGASLGSGEFGVYFHNTAGTGQILYAHSGYAGLTGGSLTTGTWYHIAVTRVAATSTVTIYVNGSSVATGTYSTAPSATDSSVVLGNHTGVAAATTMSMTEVALYPQALSSSRLSIHHAWGTAADATATAYGGLATLYGEFPYPAFNAPTSNAYGSAASTWGSFIWDGGTGAGGTMSGVDWYNVKDYGAIGNGVHDDTSAIQSAINTAQTAGAGVIYFPTGTYKVTPSGSPAVALSVTSNAIRFVGDGANASILTKSAAGTILQFLGTTSPSSGSTHVRYCSVENLGFNGNSQTGSVWQLYYVDNFYAQNCNVNSNNDLAVDCVEFWDSRFLNVAIVNCTGTVNSTTQPNVWIRNASAASGVGASTGNSNNIHFIACRFEGSGTGALWITQGTSNSSNGNNFKVISCKFEADAIQGGPLIQTDNTTKNVVINNVNIQLGGFAGGYSTAQTAISLGGSGHILANVTIGNGASATIDSGVFLHAVGGGIITVHSVIGGYTTAPATAHLNFDGSATGLYYVTNVPSFAGTQFAGSPPSTLLGVTSTTTVANSAALTNLQAPTVAANQPQVGTVYRVTGYGIFSTTGTPTLAFQLFWGATNLASIPAITTASGITNGLFRYEAEITFRTTTSCTATLELNLGTSTATDAASLFVAAPTVPVTVTTSSASTVAVAVQWGTASPSNTISLLGGVIERIA